MKKDTLKTILPYFIIVLTIICMCDLRKFVENIMIGFIALVFVLLVLMVIWLGKICIEEIKKPKN